MGLRPHGDKVKKAIENPKAKNDVDVLKEILSEYNKWIEKMDNLQSKGDNKVRDMVNLLNEYKNKVEVDLILGKGTSFLVRQKGQLKLDNSIM